MEGWKDGEDTRGGTHSSTFPFFLSSILLLILIIFPVTYAQNDAGKIEGQIVDKKKNQPLAQQKVILLIHHGEAKQQRETVTDASGRYLFDDLSIAFDAHYTVTTTYEGQEYVENDLALSEWVPTLKINIEIGAFMDDQSKVKIRHHTLVINPPPADHAPDGAVSVMEIIQVENTSDLAFKTVHNGQSAGLYFNLPNGYEELQVDAVFQQALADGQQLVSNQPLAPGLQNLAFSYVVHVDKSGLELSRELTFDTDQLSVFVTEGIPLLPQSPILGPGRQEQIHNMSYTIYATDPEKPLLAEQSAELRLKVDAAALSSQSRGERFSTPSSNPKMLALIAIAAACAGGFLVAALLKIRTVAAQSDESSEESTMPKAAPDASWLRKLDAPDLEKTRLARLELVTHLEDMYKKKEISERVYNRLRKEQADRLAAVLERIQNP